MALFTLNLDAYIDRLDNLGVPWLAAAWERPPLQPDDNDGDVRSKKRAGWLEDAQEDGEEVMSHDDSASGSVFPRKEERIGDGGSIDDSASSPSVRPAGYSVFVHVAGTQLVVELLGASSERLATHVVSGSPVCSPASPGPCLSSASV